MVLSTATKFSMVGHMENGHVFRVSHAPYLRGWGTNMLKFSWNLHMLAHYVRKSNQILYGD